MKQSDADWERKQVTTSDWEWKQITCFARACTRPVLNPTGSWDSGEWRIVPNTEPVSALLPRRSRQTRRTPTWLEDYDLCWTLKHWLELASILFYYFCCCCCCRNCKGKGCGMTRVTIVMWSASHTNRRESWHLSRHKHKPELDIKKFCCSFNQ